MGLSYPIPAAQTRVETVVVNSRFLATVAEAASTEAAQGLIKRVKTELADASSHAYAYQIGHAASITLGCSDGGEPSGTAGRPMLAVLQGSGLGDVVAVVSRYFGGTKLGTGGLVRAFGGALKATLDVLPRAERSERNQVALEIDYALYERVKLLIAAHNGALCSEDFAASVALVAVFPKPDALVFAQAIVDLSAGRVRPRVSDVTSVT
jgi:uncharacterized YigZ family protein